MTDRIMKIGIIVIAFIILGLAVLNLAGFFEEKPLSPIMTSGNTIDLNALRAENGAPHVLEVTSPSAVPTVSYTSIGSPPSDFSQRTQTTEFSGIQDFSETISAVSHTSIGPPPSDVPQRTQMIEFSGVQAVSGTQNGIPGVIRNGELYFPPVVQYAAPNQGLTGVNAISYTPGIPTYEAVIPSYPVPAGPYYTAVSINGIPVGQSYDAVSINGIPMGQSYDAVSFNGIPMGQSYEAVSINGIPASQSVSVASSQGSSSSSVSRK